MIVRILGTAGHLPRNGGWNRAALLRCCSLNHDKVYPSETRYPFNSPIYLARRDFSFDSLIYYPTLVFRYIAESGICAQTRDVFACFHDATGLSWWFTIALSGVALKILTSPLRLYQMSLIGRLEEINKMDEKAKEIFARTARKQQEKLWTPRQTRTEFRNELMRLRRKRILEQNCHPLKIILIGYMELPIWLLFSISWRIMSYDSSDFLELASVLTEQMMREGPFWCANLTVIDSAYILPALFLALQLMNVELSVIQGQLIGKDKRLMFRILTKLGRVFAVVGTIICSNIPSAVSLFWVSTAGCNLVREFMFISPKLRLALNLPYQPYNQKEVVAAFKEKLTKLVPWKGTK